MCHVMRGLNYFYRIPNFIIINLYQWLWGGVKKNMEVEHACYHKSFLGGGVVWGGSILF